MFLSFVSFTVSDVGYSWLLKLLTPSWVCMALLDLLELLDHIIRAKV